MKDKIKNGYFFVCKKLWYLRVGSRCYILPLDMSEEVCFVMFKNITEEGIQAIFKPNGERVE